MSEPMTRASFFDGFDAFASKRRIDFPSLIAEHGLTPECFSNPDTEISLNTAANLFEAAALAANDPCLSLRWAEEYRPGATGVVGYLVLHAESMRHAVQLIARYVGLILAPLEISFHEENQVGNLVWRFPAGFTAPRQQYASFIMALTIIRLRRIAGANWMPMGIELEHRALECKDEVTRVFGPNIRFDCAQNALRIRETVLNKEAVDSDERLFGLVKNLGDRLLAERRHADDIVYKTQQAIVRQFEVGDATLDAVAEKLGMSARTLQNRLSNAGTNFESVSIEIRQNLAETYLRDTDLPLTEIAFLLGFSELSAFTRAARNWFGMPPSDKRTILRRVASAGGALTTPG